MGKSEVFGLQFGARTPLTRSTTVPGSPGELCRLNTAGVLSRARHRLVPDHHRHSRDRAAAAVIANGLTGLVGFGVSLLVLHAAALVFGNAVALVLWILSSMGWNLALWWLWRRKGRAYAPARTRD